MTQGMLTVAVLVCAVVGIGGAIFALSRTPVNQWISVSRVSLEDRLRALPPSREARIIPVNRRDALLRTLPWFVPACLLAPIYVAKDLGFVSSCSIVLGMNFVYFSLIVFTCVLPALFLLLTLAFVPTGLKVLKHGYFPPLDSFCFKDTIAEKGLGSRLRGISMMVAPLIGLFICYLGYDAYSAVLDGRTTAELLLVLEQQCGR